MYKGWSGTFSATCMRHCTVYIADSFANQSVALVKHIRINSLGYILQDFVAPDEQKLFAP